MIYLSCRPKTATNSTEMFAAVLKEKQFQLDGPDPGDIENTMKVCSGLSSDLHLIKQGEETNPTRGRPDQDREQGLHVRRGLHLPGPDPPH